MKTVLCIPSDTNGAVGSYRIREPYSNIVCDDIRFIISNSLGDAWLSEDDNDLVDAVILQRPETKIMAQFAKDFRAEGKIVVVESDDDISCVPSSSPVFRLYKEEEHRNRVKYFNECVQSAHYVHVSTPQLKYGNKSVVFYNAINLKKYQQGLPKQQTIEWHGSPTHLDSLELIKPVIAELTHNGIKVRLISSIKWLESLFDPHPNLELRDYVQEEIYYIMPSQAKIFLAPLPNNKFNRAKSELKCIQAGAWKVPSISSPVSPFLRFNDLSNGGNVIVKKERPRYWLNAIYDLLGDDYLYKTHSELSYNAVVNHYSLEGVNKKRIAWWRNVFNLPSLPCDSINDKK